MDNDKRKKVYDVLTSKTGYKDSFDDFNKFMDDGAARRKVYDVLREQTGYRDSFEDFDKFMSSSHQGEMPVPIVPMRPTEPDLSFSNPSAGKFMQNGLDANEELLNDVKAEPVKDGMGRSYFPVKPQKVMEDEIRREYQVEPIESQINNAIVANEEAIRRIEQGKTEDYDRKAEEHPFLHALGGFARQHEGRVPDVNPSNDKEALRNLYAERNKLEEAKKVIEASRTDGILSNIGAGVKDAVTDMGFYDFGMTEMSDNSRLLGIKAKLDNKQPLTEDEQKLLNAAALAQGVQSSHQDRISPWYTAGQTTANMAPFMAEMLVNPAAGLGKAAQKAVTKKVSGLVGKSLTRKMLPKLSRVAGDVAGASVMTGTTGIMRTAADAEGRMLGGVNSSIRDGEIVGNGFSGGLDIGEASAKAFGANTIENWSEMLGEYFSPALKGMGMVANKGMRKMGLGRVSDFISDINSTSLARGIDDFLEKTQWNGPIGEIAEEEAGIIANSYITGDNKLSDLTDPRLQLDIVLGVGLFGGFVSGMKTIGYRSPSKIAEKDLKRAEKNASSMFDNWEDIRLEIENTDEEQLPDTLNSIIGHAAGNDNAKKAAIVDYAYSLQKWRGVNAAKLKQTVENPAEAQNLVENEEDGTGAEAIPEFDKVSVYRNFKRAERKVAQALPNTLIEKIEDVTDVDKFAADNGLNEEQKSAVTDYMVAKEPYSIYQSDVEARKEVVKSNAREQAVKDAERMSNPDTGFITQVKRKSSETPVYLVGGNLSFGDDGLLDRSNSTETVYYLDENGKRLPAPAKDFDGIVSQSSKEELVANAEALAAADFDAQENESLASPEILPPGIGETVSLDGGTYVIEGADNDNPGNFSALKLNADGEIEVTPGLGEQISLSPDEYYEAKEAELWKNDGIQPEQPVGKVDEVVAPAFVQGVDKTSEISAENASGPEMEDNKVSEESPEQRLQKVVDSLPKKKDGNIDYKALTPQQRFDYTSAAESPEVAIEDLKSDVAAKNEELEKINARLEKAIGGERVELRDTIRSKKKELDELTALFQSVVPEQPDASVNEEQPSVPEDVRTDEDYVEWVADNSDDAEEVLGAYSVAKELASHEQTLKPWQRELLGRKVSTSSFVRFGDRNHITGTLAKGWLRKDGEEIDSIAQELTANGVDVSEQDIVDFILDNPSNRVSEISDTMRSLSSRFSEIATKETGIPVGGPESNTGKLYIQLKEANKKIDELTDEQKADMRNALIADMDASDVQRSGDYYESLADYAEQYDRFRDEMNAEEADEAVIRQMEAESPTLYHGGFTADELDDIYSQIENDNGTERQTEDSGETQPALSGDEIEQREEPGIPDAVGAEDSESEGQDSGVVSDIEEIQDNTLDNEDESLSLHLNSKEEENGTISESVPQGEHREEAPQNPRMEEASIGLRDRVEASTRNAQASGGTLSERKKQEIEQRSAESYAKETGQWIPMSDIFAWQPMPSGNENDVYLNTDDGQVYKVNNLMNSKGILPLFDRLRLHNQLFPESRYEFVGFTGFDNGSVFPIFKQEYVNDAEPASPEEIDSYMRSLGFKQTGEAAYSNGDVVISDLRPRNVLKDTDGDLYVVDADFKKEDAVSFEASPISPGENVLDYAERISREKEMHDVRQSVDTNPTDAQKEAGNYKKGHIRLDGYDITIENPKGSERSGTDAKGGKWSVTMNNDYGYIRGTQGVDGDHIDVFLSDDPTTGNVYVIDQVKEDGSFDEHKVMYGFGSALAAKRAYLSNYSKGWNGLGKITQVSKDEFRKWVNSSSRKTKPFAEYKSVKMESDVQTDRQGNPVDADGKLIIEDVNSINDITDADFTNPTRSIGLPAIPRNVSDAIGADGKRVIIKKNILEKNRRAHSDVTPVQSREILLSALYAPDLYGQNQKAKRPYNWIVINTKDEAGHNRIVLLEVNDNKDNVEIVHWHYTDERGVEKIRRQAKREDGQLLILPSVASEEVGALSDPTLDLPSADKDSEQSGNGQEKDVFIPFSDFMRKGMQKKFPADYDSLQSWKEQSPETYSEEYDNLLPEYGEYLKDLSKEGILQAIYDHSSVKQQKNIRDAFSDADLDYTDYLDTKVERKRNPKAKRNDVSIKKGDRAIGRFFDGTVVSGMVEEVDQDRIQIRSERNGRIYNILPDKILNEEDNDIRFREVSDYTDEEQAIIDEAKKSGTYMKAPNGRPTNLTEKQWVQVRTKTFKEWFGDWEKAVRVEKLRGSKPIELSGNDYQGKYELNSKSAENYIIQSLRGAYVNKDTGNVVNITRASRKVAHHDAESDIHLKSIAYIPQMIENAVFVDEIYNEKNSKFDSYRYYVVGLKIDGVDYTAKLAVGQKSGESYYDHALTEIEKSNLLNLTNGVKADVSDKEAALSGIKDKRLFSLLQTNASKVVDENGEPAIVFHGTPLSRKQITPNRGWQRDGLTYISQEAPFHTFRGGEYSGLIFTSVDASKARDIAEKRAMSIPDDELGNEQWTEEGYVYDLYANTKNPFDPQKKDTVIEIIQLLGKNVPTLSFYGGKGENITSEDAINIASSNQNSWLVTETPEFLSEIKKMGYDGLVGYDEGVKYIAVMNPNQVKDAYDNTGVFSTNNDDIRFRDIDTEDKKELVAVHNISEEKLKEALDLGGFPMPSIAITKVDVGHTTFGDISLVFDKESINPTDRRNKVYGEDAWTPTFPNVGYKLNGDKTSDIYRRANKVGRLPLFNPTSFHPDSYERYINGLGAESLVNHFKNDYNAKQLYLSETGNAVEEYERHEVDKYLPDKVALYEKVLKEIGVEKLKNERNDALENDVKRFIEEHYNIDLDAVKPHIAKTRINNTIRYAIDYVENGNKVIENDFEATKKKIDERIDPKKFEEWLEELFTDVVEKKGIRNDKDLFTPSGNSRKWEQLYDEITLDNVVNAMQKQAAKGGQGLFGASIFGAAQEEYKSIDEIRKAARERIRTMDEADYKAQRDVITDRLSDIKIPGVGNGFSDTMDMVQNIQDAVARSHTAKGIYKYLKEFYPKVTMEAANEIADIVKDIQRMSARYFEAKPYRAVGFDEVRLTVVPSDTDANLVEQLKRRGIEVRKYERGNEGQRGQIVKEATGEMNLRFRENGEVNRKFNEELQLQIDGTLPEGHVYQLGNPSRELLSAGIPDLPIELSAERLEKKASKEYESNHPFNLESIKNLPQALNYPIAVFEARKKNGAKVVLTELNENGNNFIAAIKVRKSDDSRTVEVNDIRSLYPKDRKSGILEWINSGLLKWVDKNKASDFFSTQWPNYIGGGENKSEASDRSLAYISASAPIADATYKEELSSATKIVENFNNPTPEQGEIISAVEELSSKLNTPVHIVRSSDELPDGAARRAIMSGRRGVKAWFTNGEVMLYLPHATSTDDARRSVLHEVVGHKGLRDLFGKEEFDGMMEKLYGQLPDDVRREIHDTAKDKYSGDIAVAMDEYLAGQAELDETPSWWNRVVSAVRGFLREMGVDVLLSSNDVKYLLWKSKNRLMNTDNGLAVINKIAAGEAMKEKLHIGEYSRTPEQEKADYDKAVKVVGDFAGSHAGAANALVIRSRDLMRRQLEARGISAEDIEKYEQWFDEKGTCAFWSPKYQTIFVLNKSVSEKEINGYLWHENVHHAFDVLYGSEEKKSRIARLYEELSPYSASDFAHIEGLYVDESVETQKEECVTALFEELTKRYEGKTEDVISKMQGKGIISDSTLKELYNYIHYGTKEGYGSRRIRPGFDGFLEKPVEEKTMEVRNSDGDFRRSAESEGSGHPVRGMVEEGAGSISGTGESGTEERNKGNRPLGRALDTGYELDMRNSGDAGHHKEEKGAGSQGTEPRAKEGNQTGEGVTRFRDTTGDKPSDGTVEQYEEELKKQSFKAKEAYQDSMLALKKLQDVVVKRSGKALKSFEDAYTAENHLSSINTAEVESYGEHFFRPMIEAIGELVNNGNSYEDVKRYVFAKHGLERNEVFAERDARNAVTEKYWREKELVNRQYYDGKLMEDEYEEKMQGIQQAEKDFYEKQYEENRLRDYSGLTALTGEKEDYEDAAQAIVDEFERGNDVTELWRTINNATKETLNKTYESGLMDKATYERVRVQFKHYVPLRGWNEKTAADVYEYLQSEVSPVNATMRTAKGRMSLADDPFATIGNMAESNIFMSNRNLMKQRFMNMVLNHPSDVVSLSEAWYVKDASTGDWVLSAPDILENDSSDEIRRKIEEHEERMRLLSKDGDATKVKEGLNIDYRISARQAKEHMVVVKRNGKEYVMYINGNPRAAQAINGMTNPNVNEHPVLKRIGNFNRQLAANFTTRNPAFVATNLSRDLIYAVSSTYVKEGTEYGNKYLKNIPKAMKVVMRNLRGKGGNSIEDIYFREFLANGGETGYADLKDVKAYKKFVEHELGKITGKKDYFKYLKACASFFSLLNRWAENVSRFDAYMTSREMGKNVFDSVSEAKEVTVNFNKKGAGYKTKGFFGLTSGTFRELFLFFNAAVQSLANFSKMAYNHKKGFVKMVGGFAVAGYLVPMLNGLALSLFGDDGDDDYYNNLPEWVRRNNICIYRGNGKFITIPLPIELRAFYGLGEMAYQVSAGNVHSGGKIAYEAISQITELLPINPFGNDEGMMSFVPDFGRPIVQILINKNYLGKPIYKEYPYNENMPEWTKTYNGTTKWLKNLSEWTNELTGGNKYKRGWVDVNPAKVEHLFESYFGGMAKTINQASNTLVAGVESAVNGEMSEDLVWRNVPILNRFVSDGSDDRTSFSKVNSRYYELYDVYKDVKQQFSGYKKEILSGNLGYLEDLSELQNSREFDIYAVFEKYRKSMDKLNKLEKSFPESSKSERKEVEKSIMNIKKEIVRAVDGE